MSQDLDLSELAQCALSAALAAGKVIQAFCGREVEVFSKKGGDTLASQVVTEVDRKAQDAILAVLRPSIDKYNLALLTEESEDDGSRFQKKYFWCIDPLDGTLAFSEGENGYAVSIGLVARDGFPQIGVIYDPVSEILWQAAKGQGVKRNGQHWKVTDRHDTLTFTYDRSFEAHPQFSSLCHTLSEVGRELGLKGIEALQHGGSVMNAMHALENGPGCHLKLPKPEEGGGSLWDYAATACIFEEAGAWTTDVFGHPLELNRRESTFMNHRGVLYASDPELAAAITQSPFFKQ
ncbi:MAG: inositol monophosphatase family protein [Opitutales bacterium]|nr:inositol monophosphatase family protein [Opitutales bacterium]